MGYHNTGARKVIQMGLIIETTRKTTSGSKKASTLTLDDCIKEIQSKAGYSALMLARMCQLGASDTDVRIIITLNDIVIESGDDTYYVSRDMDKMSRI